MKKLAIVLTVLLIASTAFGAGFQASRSSGEKTADAAIYADNCVMTSVHIITDGTNNAKVILYDNASAASGTVLFEMTVIGGDNYGSKSWVFPVEFINGIYADVSGTGASYIIEYIPR